MVRDEHQFPGPVLGVEAPSGIGHDEGLDPHDLHHTHWKDNLAHRVSFIEVNSPLHDHDVQAFETTQDQLPHVAFHSRLGKVGNLVIAYLVSILYGLGQSIEARTEYQSNLRLVLSTAPYILGGLLVFLACVVGHYFPVHIR